MAVQAADVFKSHDKVYGLIGILPPAVAAKIQVDYNLPVSAVFTSFATAIIETTGTLDLLDLCYGPHTPTWVPNLTPTYRMPSISPLYNVTGGRQLPKPQVVGQLLVAFGFVVDVIRSLGAVGSETSGHLDSLTPPYVVQQSQNPHDDEKHAYGSDSQLTEALCRTLVGHIVLRRVRDPTILTRYNNSLDKTSDGSRLENFFRLNKDMFIAGKTVQERWPRTTLLLPRGTKERLIFIDDLE
jgi:hypothetical protein